MANGWNPRKIITNLTKEEFKEWCIENKENLQYYIDSLDDTTYGQFEKWIISQYDLRTWNTLIDSMGNPSCKRPGGAFSYNYLVGKPTLNGKTFADKYTILGGENITVTDAVYDPKTKTTSFTINGTPAGEWGKIIGNVHDQKDVQAKVIYSAEEPEEPYEGDIWVNESSGGEVPAGIAKWGNITGNIEDQTDLQEALENVSPAWGKIKGDILDQEDLQKELATKQNEITPANRLDYETLLMNLPSLNTKVLKGNVTLDDINVYDKTKVDQMIATLGGDYLGYNETPITEDYKEKSKWAECSAKIYEAIATVAKKNDWCYIVRKDENDKLYYQRWICSGEKVEGQVYTLFQFLFELDIDITDLQQTVNNHTTQITNLTLNKEDKHESVTINGTSGTFTDEEWNLLESSSANYIIYKGLGLRQVYFSYSEDTVVYFASFAQYTPANDEKLTPEIATVTVKISDKSYQYAKFTLATANDLDAEAQLRAKTDNSLQKQIDTLSSGSATKESLSNEIERAIKAEEKNNDYCKSLNVQLSAEVEARIKLEESLAKVAKTGSYNDLVDKPESNIPLYCHKIIIVAKDTHSFELILTMYDSNNEQITLENWVSNIPRVQSISSIQSTNYYVDVSTHGPSTIRPVCSYVFLNSSIAVTYWDTTGGHYKLIPITSIKDTISTVYYS